MAEQKHWMAVYTKPRNEKKVAERLEKQLVEVYCPLQTTLRQWSDRKKKVKIPVFPSYVFVHVADSDRTWILEDPGILNFVFWLGKPAIIRDDEIENIRQFLGEHADRELEVRSYKQGDEIEIIAGAFIGRKGTVQEADQKSVILLVESMGMIVRVKTPYPYLQ